MGGMNRIIVSAVALVAAVPAHATGGFTCETAGPRSIRVSLGFAHTPGAPLFLAQLADRGRNVPVKAPQWWLDNREVRLVLASPAATRQELVLKAVRNGRVYDGSIWRGGKRRWVRCNES